MNDDKKIIKILKEAGYTEEFSGVFVYDGGYKDAYKYFYADVDMRELLENLEDLEKEKLHFTSIININTKPYRAVYRIGLDRTHSRNFSRYDFDNGIDNTTDIEDDFDGVYQNFIIDLIPPKTIETLREPCNCGSHTRHNNGGNYHRVWRLLVHRGKYYILRTNTREFFPNDNMVLTYDDFRGRLEITYGEGISDDRIFEARKQGDAIEEITLQQWQQIKEEKISSGWEVE